MNHTQTHAEDIQDMMAAIVGLADLLEQDGCREGSEDDPQMLGRFHRGCMVTAIKHLSHHASSRADTILELEARKAAGAGGDV
ncbi:hypothetical protein [Halomonas sp. KO116]|uniref:hypothetical protein n=1 Tax=Halomonas sp. KO116 TaxID=1504981 RepID=UPI0004E30304|nr:hypothetical protein [Halomonas sp. KO116]AJY50638.1 hypothetical protein KO116_02161 [Halomonas sp. KO116]